MNLRQLEAFRATVRTGSVSRAAEQLEVSQPSISRLIRDLEQSVGFKLFMRTGRGLRPTTEAQQFCKAVESTFLGIARLKDLADVIKTSRGGGVVLGIIPSLVQQVMPEVIATVSAQYADISVSVAVRNTPGIMDAISIGQMDLGVVSPSYYTITGVHILREFSLPFECIIPEDHELAREDGPLNLVEASEHTHVSLAKAYLDMTGVDALYSEKLTNVRITSHSVPAVAAIARVTGSLALVDPFSARTAVAQGGVVSRKINQDIEYKLALITRDPVSLSLAGQTVVEAFASELQARFDATDTGL